MTPERSPRRILIVDDQQPIHDTFERVFAIKGPQDDMLADFESRFLDSEQTDQRDADGMPTFQLDHANSGHEAIDLVKTSVASGNQYSIAFVDMRMPPGLDGMETTEILWQIDPDLHVVICTAYSDHVWDDVLKRLGYSDRLLLLKKPFESDEARQLALALSEKSRLSQIQRKKVVDLGREVERRREAEEAMRVMAHRDPLTKLPNRPYLIDKLSRLVQQKSYQPSLLSAVLFLDLDNFKIINDSLGHDAGDELLNQVAARLKTCVRDCDTTCRTINVDQPGETVRLGGDEFVVLLEDLVEPTNATNVAKRIVDKISQPFQLGDRLVNVGASVGVAYLDEQIKDANEALRNADTAMYRAKQTGRGRFAVFDQTMHDDVMARLELENQLRRAVVESAFTLNYQPIISMKTGNIQGVETLLRWRDEQGNNVSPSVFIPVIEEIGLIGQVGEWVLENAMRDMTALSSASENARDIYLGVNVSDRQLSDPFFLNQLETILERTGFDRQRLTLEMNESNDSRGHEQVLATLLELNQSGVKIQIDDFGKGQSSLTCFQKYPIEAVKIDRSFTATISTDQSHAAIADAIVQLAHNLNARIVAEGVESQDQLDSLRKWGCDLAQGYFFAPPLAVDSLRQLLQNPMQSEGIKSLQSNLPPLVNGLTSPISPTTLHQST